MKKDNEVVGGIALQHNVLEGAYTQDNLDVLQAIADRTAIALDNAKRIKELETANTRNAEYVAVLTRNTIATDVIHRVNNLVGTIPFTTQQIRDELDLSKSKDQTINQYIDQIDEDIQNLISAAADLRYAPQPVEVNSGELLTLLLKRIETEYGVDVTGHIQPGLSSVEAISSTLFDAIWNVMSNGAEAMPEGGRLTVTAMDTEIDDNWWVQIVVKDDGLGISPEDIGKIFNTDFSTKGKGRGYGLWRSKNIIETMGGSIEVKSKLGVGSEFIILLSAKRTLASQSKKVLPSKKRVLIVEDMNNWREKLGSLLRKKYDLSLARNYDEAIAALKNDDFELTILDVRLDDNNRYNHQGIDLLRMIREKKLGIPVIMLTGHFDSISPHIIERYKPEAIFRKEALNIKEFGEKINELAVLR